VLPWAAFEDFNPPADWHHHEDFLAALEVWADEADVIANGGEFPKIRLRPE
jgi:hypothetical protein